jgi:predicted TIM-barrel fold metal-dependent hydrolase
MSGIAISPACQGYHPQHSTAMRMYESCAERGLPVFVTMPMFHTSATVLEFARPILWDEVCRSIPSLHIVISQLGYPWIDETLILLAKHENVHADLSGVASRPWQLYGALQNALALGVMEKLFFGSGFPLHQPAKVIEALYSINAFSHGSQLPSIPRTQIRGIIERDSLTCIGIDALITPRAHIEIEESGINIDRPGRLTDRRGGLAS